MTYVMPFHDYRAMFLPLYRFFSLLPTPEGIRLYICIMSASATLSALGGGGRLPNDACLNCPSSYT